MESTCGWSLLVGLLFFENVSFRHVRGAAQSLIGNLVDPQNYFSAIFCHLMEYESQINLCPPIYNIVSFLSMVVVSYLIML